MSIRFRGLRLSKRALISCLVLLLVIGVSVALVFAMQPKVEKLNVIQNVDEKSESISNEPLMDAKGWNPNVVSRLEKNLSKVSDNMALGNANGIIVSSIVTFGGIEWTVVYKQNNTITLLANESVASLPFSEVRSFLNDEFYPAFCEAVGYSELENLIVPFGSFSIYYQVPGVQGVQIKTLKGNQIEANDEIVGDKFWIPSAYELGGFVNTELSPKARANSFKTVNTKGVEVNTGLFNTSNSIRTQVDSYWIRNTTQNGNLAMVDGIVVDFDDVTMVRPCVNLKLPEQKQEQTEGVFSASNDLNFATYTGPWASGGTNIYLISSTSDLLALSEAVIDGYEFDGVTFNLTCDLDFSTCTVWMPIGYVSPTGSNSKIFKGTFNGQGHKISNLSSANSGLAGLFGYIAANSSNNNEISNVGVVGSSWYTTNQYVGGIVGYATATKISCCYNECGISGSTFVGGIVGGWLWNSSNGKVVDCYNTGAISGTDYVGGIAGGQIRTSATPVVRCYNKGSITAAGSNVDGIGINTSRTNCFSYNTTSLATNLTYTEMQTQSKFTNFDFSAVWYMPKSKNDRMPMLRVFITSVDVQAFAYINGVGVINQNINTRCTAGVFSNTAGTTPVSTNLVPTTNYYVIATATYATGYHYHLEGWYYAELNSEGVPINFVATGWTSTNSVSGSTTKYSSTQKFNASDEYVLVAKFERLFCYKFYENARGFTFSGSDYTTNLSVTYTKPAGGTATPYAASGAAYSSGDAWYPEGTVVAATLNLTNVANTVFWYIRYSTTAVSSVPGNNLVNSSGMTVSGKVYSYSMVMQDTSAYTNYSGAVLPAGDSLYLYMDHVRRFNVTVALSLGTSNAAIPKGTFGDVTVTVNRTSSGSYSGGLTYTATNVSEPYSTTCNNYWCTESFNPLAVTAGTNYDSTKLSFTNWILYYNGADKGTLSTGSKSYSSLNVNPSSVTAITIYARFAAQKATVNLAETSGQESYGLVRIDTSSTLTTISSEVKQKTNVTVGTTLYIYVLPAYNNYWMMSQIVTPTGTTTFGNTPSGPTNSTTGIYRIAYTVLSNATANFTVSYAARSDLNVTFEIDKSRVPSADQGYFTLPSNITNKVSTYAISSAAPKLTIATTNYANTKYYLYAVQKKINSTYTNIGTKNPGTTYPTQYAVLDYLGSNTTVGALLTFGGTAASFTNTTAILRLVIYPINYTLTTVVCCDPANSNDPQADEYNPQTIEGLWSYTQKVGTSNATNVTNGQAQLGSVVTLTIQKLSYDVTKVTISGASWSTTPTVNGDNYGAAVTGAFTMPAAAVTITITVVTKPYAMYVCDNLVSNSNITNINGNNGSYDDISPAQINVRVSGNLNSPNSFTSTRTRIQKINNEDKNTLPGGYTGTVGGSTISCSAKLGTKFTISNILKEYTWTYESKTYHVERPKIYVYGSNGSTYSLVNTYNLSGDKSGKYSFDLWLDNRTRNTNLVVEDDDATLSNDQLTAFSNVYVVVVYEKTQYVKVKFDDNLVGALTKGVLVVLGKKVNDAIVSTTNYFVIPKSNTEEKLEVPGDGEYEVLLNVAMFARVEMSTSSTGTPVIDAITFEGYDRQVFMIGNVNTNPDSGAGTTSNSEQSVFVFVIV